MPEKASGERVYGPYPHRDKWRIVVINANGDRTNQTFETEAEAGKVAAEIRTHFEARSMSSSVAEYLASMRERGLRSSTIERAEDHLHRFFALDRNGARPLRWLTTARAGALYASYQTGAVDTHRNGLAAAKSFGKWATRQGWLATNPFADVEPVGRRRRGKPQLRIAEARQLDAFALARADKDDGALVTLLCLYLGLRAFEAISRDVRDVDDGGRLLWITDSAVGELKTKDSKRVLEVPEHLRPFLLARKRDAQAAERPGSAPLFVDKHGVRRTRHWVHDQVVRMCQLAEVPRVTPHGLRGTQSTIATAEGGSAQLVAAGLGHANPAITAAAYIDKEVASDAQARRAWKVLAGGRT